jgi:hypothetical protein
MHDNMRYCCEAYFYTVSNEECVPIDEENMYCQLNILVKFNQLATNLDHVLDKSLCVPSHRIPFCLENQAPNHFGGLNIFQSDFTSQYAISTDNCPEICSGWEDHHFIQILCMGCIGFLLLDKQLHVVFYRLDETKITHLLMVTNMQSARVHLKEQSGRQNVFQWTTNVVTTLLS